MKRTQTVYVPVVLAVPAVGVLLWGVFIAAVAAALIAWAVACTPFSSEDYTVPANLGDCAPFCALRTSTAPAPEATR